MLLKQLRSHQSFARMAFMLSRRKFYGLAKVMQITKPQEYPIPKPQDYPTTRVDSPTENPETIVTSNDIPGEMFPTTCSKTVPMVVTEREPIVLPFDDMPGPGSLKLLSKARSYLSKTGTQLTAGALTLGINIGAYALNRRPTRVLSGLFDTYGPVVRFVSPVGGDIVLINHPCHIQQVFATEGEHPVRSMLDSLEKFRSEKRIFGFSGLYNIQGEEWARHRNVINEPLQNSLLKNMSSLEHVCDTFVDKICNTRNCHDEKAIDEEVHKWAFDCMGNLIFSKKFTMLNTELVYSQCDMSWLYNALERSTDAIIRCESGLQMWKVFPTWAWHSLIKHCDVLDNLIGKYVMEAEKKMTISANNTISSEDMKGMSLINSLLAGEEKLSPDDICTVLMDMLLLGVNTVSSSMSFMMYFLAKHQKVQRKLHRELRDVSQNMEDISRIKQKTPYLQACIKETLRLVPPIPVLTRVLPKNITLDKYNIPRGTLIIMSTQDASLKECNFDDASKFNPERWLSPESKDYSAFASIPFGFGNRKCIGQNIAETMLSIVTYKIIQKFKLEYHYGEIQPTNTFIVKPNKPLKIRFIDRM